MRGTGYGNTSMTSSATSSRSSLPSLTSMRMNTPPPFGETSFMAPQNASFVGQGPRHSSSSSSASVCSSSSSTAKGGFWKNPILYKTTVCDNWAAQKPCKYGSRCWYAHGFKELRYVPRLDQLPENVREALFVEPALARLFFQEMASLDASTRECDSRASLLSSSSSRLSMSPSSSMMSSTTSPMTSSEMTSPSSLNESPLKRSDRWAPGVPWSEATPRASKRDMMEEARGHNQIDSEYRLFGDCNHPLSIDLSFLKESN